MRSSLRDVTGLVPDCPDREATVYDGDEIRTSDACARKVTNGLAIPESQVRDGVGG